IGSINVFESEDAANNANQQVRKEVGNSASDMLQHVETKVWRITAPDFDKVPCQKGCFREMPVES
ncbi:MAG: hypothetical protein WA813_13580, partial [Beijerinckiaceae bacterium]